MKNTLYHLYLKIHNKTNLHYLGYTSKDPYQYTGSGIRWQRHLKKHGIDIRTYVLFSSESKDDLLPLASELSIKWNIIESKNFANLMNETLSGYGVKFSKEAKMRISNRVAGSKWYNDGVNQLFTKNPPIGYTKGRLPFNNIGASIGASITRGKVWANKNGKESMFEKSKIPNDWNLGRIHRDISPTKKLSTNTEWYNNGESSIMRLPNDVPDGFVKGRLPFRSKRSP